MFGLFAFNAGSVADGGGSANDVGLAVFNTILSGSAAGVTTLLIAKFQHKKWSFLLSVNGTLTGMVNYLCRSIQYVSIRNYY